MGGARGAGGGGATVERAARTSCRSWPFAEGQQFTVAAFCGPRGATEHLGVDERGRLGGFASSAFSALAGGEGAGGEGAGGSGSGGGGGGPAAQEHAGAFLYFAAADARSHFVIQEYSQTLDAVSSVASRSDGLRTLLHGGTPQDPPWAADRIGVAVLLLFLFVTDSFSSHPTLTLALPTLATALIGRTIYRRRGRRCRSLLLATASCLYLTFLLLPQRVWLVNRSDAAILSEREDRSRPALAAHAIQLALGCALVAAIVREGRRVPGRISPCGQELSWQRQVAVPGGMKLVSKI